MDLVPEREIWSLQYGPCFCRSNPSEPSFDFVRFRTTRVDARLLDHHTLVVSDRVIDGSRSVYHMVRERMPAPGLVISVASCPAAGRFWEELPVSWTPVADLFRVDAHISECIAGRPEALLAAVLEVRSRPVRQPEAV